MAGKTLNLSLPRKMQTFVGPHNHFHEEYVHCVQTLNVSAEMRLFARISRCFHGKGSHWLVSTGSARVSPGRRVSVPQLPSRVPGTCSLHACSSHPVGRPYLRHCNPSVVLWGSHPHGEPTRTWAVGYEPFSRLVATTPSHRLQTF